MYKNKILEAIYPIVLLERSLKKMTLTGHLSVRLDNLETGIQTKVCSKETNLDTLKFLHALEEFGAHLGARCVHPDLKYLEGAKNARDQIRRSFNMLSLRYLEVFHPENKKEWLDKPWLSSGFEEDNQAFDFVMGELLKYGLPLCYKENTLFSLLFKEILTLAVDLFYIVYKPGSKRIPHRVVEYPHLDVFTTPTSIELLGVTKSKDMPNGMTQALHELTFGTVFK